MTRRKKHTPAELAAAFTYHPETGVIVRNATGLQADKPLHHGYLYICHQQTLYLAHRVAWAITHGFWPALEIDHINGNKSDNRLVNLREASRRENMQNQGGKRATGGSSNLLGVFRNTRGGKPWVATIKVNGKNHYLGRFDEEWEAHAAYLRAKDELHPFNERI